MQFGVKIRPHPPVLVKINGEAIVINFSTLLLAAFLQAKQHSSCNIYTDGYYNVLGERCELFFPPMRVLTQAGCRRTKHNCWFFIDKPEVF